MIRMKVKDLREAGLQVDPADPSNIIPIHRQPDDTWSLADLARYASGELAESDRLEAASTQLSRRSSVHCFRAGHALSLARPRLKAEGNWCHWQDEHNLNRTSAWEAIELFERAKSEDAVRDWPITAAKYKFGITKGSAIVKESSPAEAPASGLAPGVLDNKTDGETTTGRAGTTNDRNSDAKGTGKKSRKPEATVRVPIVARAELGQLVLEGQDLAQLPQDLKEVECLVVLDPEATHVTIKLDATPTLVIHQPRQR